LKTGIVGYGHVGKALHRVFTHAVAYDPYVGLKTSKAEINACQLAFVCVPTPGEGDVSAVDEVVSWMAKGNPSQVICVKSTVPPGTTYTLSEKYNARIVFSPEYEGETPWQKAIGDWPFIIVGGNVDDAEIVLQEYGKILGPQRKYIKTDSTTAELVKYAENVWLAMQVTWANEMFEVCRALGGRWSDVRELWGLDPRVSLAHTLVFEGDRGFAGRCLPKDLDAIIKSAKDNGYSPEFLEAIRQANLRFRSLNETRAPRSWIPMIKKQSI
jgi:UDPglucose 6-dehydrogenase